MVNSVNAVVAGLVGFALLAFCACGKYGPPLAPEYFSPEAIKELQVTPSTAGVLLTWKAPESDRSGKELKEIEGYIVCRDQEIADQGGDDAECHEIGRVPDNHLKELKRLRDEAYAANRPTRRVTVPAESKRFEYLDKAVIAGNTYRYVVAPYNQGGVKGEMRQQIRIRFVGEGSTFQVGPYQSKDLGDSDLTQKMD